MQTLRQPEADLSTKATGSQETIDLCAAQEAKIHGFDTGRISLLKEPSLYFSLVLILAFSATTLSSTPVLFWVVFLSMSAVAISLHFLAERLIFSAKEENKQFTFPYEGAFLIAFGAVLPGLSILAFAVLSMSLSSAIKSSWWIEAAEMSLLLLVPALNFAVWSQVKRRYLVRPRLTGLMNGLALGLSASWTLICLKCLFFSQASPYFDLAWPFILLASPFSLVAAVILGFDLWRKTEVNISRIASTFSVVGVFLSLLFVFGPVIRPLFIQYVMQQAANGSPDAKNKAVSFLRGIAAGEDLQPVHSGSDFWSLGRLFIPVPDPDLYFKLTGKVDQNAAHTGYYADLLQESGLSAGSKVGPRISGLSLSKSQIFGKIDSATLSSSIDWTLVFRNTTSGEQEARGEIALPAGAAVSRLTLWVNGQPEEGAFATTEKAESTSRSIIVSEHRELVMVNASGPDRILVRVSPVPEKGGEVKIRLGLKVPVSFSDRYHCSIKLPRLMDTNFAQPKRNRIHLVSSDYLTATLAGLASTHEGGEYALDGVIKRTESDSDQPESVAIERSTPLAPVAIADWYSHGEPFIVQDFKEVTSFVPRRLFVVIDSSAGLKSDAPQIKEALASIPTGFNPQIYLACDRSAETPQQSDISPKSLNEAQSMIVPETFVGGHDNAPTLKEALENTAEESGGAVLWIHGPQPLSEHISDSGVPDLVHKLYLYDFAVGQAPNSLFNSLGLGTLGSMITYVPVHRESTVATDLKKLFSSWKTATKSLVAVRTITTKRPNMEVVSEGLVSAQVTSLWAKDQVEKLLAQGQEDQAVALAAKYHLVTAVTGAVILEKPSEDTAQQLASSEGARVIRALVQPRYGQSNEVGMIADYGYDTARDVSRAITAASAAICLLLFISFVRAKNRGKMTGSTLAKLTALMIGIPTLVHLLGTFAINNFGGLGGGL